MLICDQSVDPMSHEATSELCVLVLHHLWEIEVVFEELFADIAPQSRFSGSQYLADVGAIRSIVTDDVSIQFSGYGPSETPIKEEGVENAHSHQIKSGVGHPSINETYFPQHLLVSQRLATHANGNIANGITTAFIDIAACSLFNFIRPAAESLSSRRWSMKSWYYQWFSLISDGFPP